MRAPFQVLAIPFRRGATPLYCILHRADFDQWQFVAGGGEDTESPAQAVRREIREETGIADCLPVRLTTLSSVPASVISQDIRKHWAGTVYVLPEYAFAFECSGELQLSHEHTHYEWLTYEEAMARLKWDSNKTALTELKCRLEDATAMQATDVDADAAPDMCVPCGDGLINIRVGAIIARNGRFLMVGSPHATYLYSVGGRIKMGETAEEAIVREVREETGVTMPIKRLAYVHENYFSDSGLHRQYRQTYELSFFYLMDVPENFDVDGRLLQAAAGTEFLTWVTPDDPRAMFPSFMRTAALSPADTLCYVRTDDRKPDVL